MLKKYFKKKSVISIIIDIAIGIMLILLLIPATRKDMASIMLRPTLVIHQPKVNKDKQQLDLEQMDWSLETLYGDPAHISQFTDKVVFINFWATWCPPCIAEMPDLQKLYNTYGDKVSFLFITNEDPKVVKAFMEKKGYTIPVYFPKQNYPEEFDVQSLPTSYLLNKKGEMVIDKKGVAKWNSQRMRSILDVLINQ